jgi:hypothetical protein
VSNSIRVPHGSTDTDAYSYLHLSLFDSVGHPRSEMLARIKLIGSAPCFSDIAEGDYVLAPEKPVKRRRHTKKIATNIKELDDSYEPFTPSDGEA